VLWGAIVSDAIYRGIELVPQRLDVAERARRRLGLDNLELRQGNVRSRSFEDGTLFFLFDPFFTDTMRRVAARLARIAKCHQIRIGSTWGSNLFFARQPWLREILTEPVTNDDPYRLRIFASI
jgi:hypothetical protein